MAIEPRYKAFQSMLLELAETRSMTQCQEILERWLSCTPGLPILLNLACNPFIQYHLTSATATKRGRVVKSFPDDSLEKVLWYFQQGERGNASANRWVTWEHRHPSWLVDLGRRVLDKDLKVRVGVKTINKALKKRGCRPIPEFEVMLAYPWEQEEVWEHEAAWYMSRKLDGVRCCAFLRPGQEPQLFSRQGKPFDTLPVLVNALRAYEGRPVMLDGELALKTATGEDDFQGLMRQIRRKNHVIKNPCYHVFDSVLLEGDEALFKTRFFRARCILGELDSPHLSLVKHVPVTSAAKFFQSVSMAERKGWEGLMLRQNAPHTTGRTRTLLKVKKMQDLEVRITDVEFGPMLIPDADGNDETRHVMTAVVTDYGDGLRVGSGWSRDQRIYYRKHPEELIGQVLTVQYFEKTTNMRGGDSLRFPVAKWAHGPERDT